MEWRGRKASRNVEDRRRGGGAARAGGIGGVGLILLLVLGYFLGFDVTSLMQQQPGSGQIISGGGSTQLSPEEEARGEFVAVVLNDTELVWNRIFEDQLGRDFREPTLVLFSQVTPSPCGNASGATGPFYCPADRKVYLDTSFFDTMQRKMGAGGDFAAAYVVAHEVAHHVQNELGDLGKANQARSRMNKTDANRVSVMIELQADCYSGIWARYAQEAMGTLEEGDLQEAINAAKQIGDDTLARNAGQRPMPHTFTHGSSEQRMRWFATGYQSADLAQCDTFSARQL